MMLHNDEGYQKDVGDPKAMDVILTELKRHPDRLPRYALSQKAAVLGRSLILCLVILVRAALSALHAMQLQSVCCHD